MLDILIWGQWRLTHFWSRPLVFFRGSAVFVTSTTPKTWCCPLGAGSLRPAPKMQLHLKICYGFGHSVCHRGYTWKKFGLFRKDKFSFLQSEMAAWFRFAKLHVKISRLLEPCLLDRQGQSRDFFFLLLLLLLTIMQSGRFGGSKHTSRFGLKKANTPYQHKHLIPNIRDM